MRKIIILIVAILIIVVFSLELKADSIQKSIIAADAKWVVHIDMKKFTSTKLYELFMNDESTVKIRKKTDKFFKKLNFDPLKDIMGMIPGMGKMKDALKGDEFKSIEAILSSMTPKERKIPKILDASRRRRIASGSGTSVQQVNQVVKQFEDMKKMMKQMYKMSGKMKGGKGGMPSLSQLKGMMG